MTEQEICSEACKLFAERDRLVAETRAIDARLSQLRADYRVVARTVGIDMVRFRNVAHSTKVAA